MSSKSLLNISLSPHIQSKDSTSKIMWSVSIALIPALTASVYYFGINALKVSIAAVIFCVLIEFIITKFMLKSELTINDGSAALTGLLLAFNTPSSIPLWQLFAGSVIAIGISKMAFGGIGKNPFNPALVGRAFMLASFPVDMTTWPKPITQAADAITTATPLGVLAKDGALKVSETISNLDLFLGNIKGCIGEVSAIAIIIGGLFLLWKKIITWHIPFFYLGALASFTTVLYLINPDKYASPLFHILAGGAMLGAWFMATDMVTSPMTIKGQIIFAIGGGLLCGIIRVFGSYPEGCSYSILIMNAFVPLIDKMCKPKAFGKEVNYG